MSLGTPGHFKENLDFLGFPTLMYLPRTGFSLRPGKPVILGSLSSYLREESVNTRVYAFMCVHMHLHNSDILQI